MNIEDIDRLIYDFLSGTLSGEEAEEVKQWIQADEANQACFRKFKEDFLCMRWGFRDRLISGNLEQLQRTIRQRRRFRIVKSIAAVVIMLLSIGGGWLFYTHITVENPVVAVVNNPILPGKPQAILVLSSGEKIQLDSMNCEVEEQNGVSIQVAAGGSLTYHLSDSAHKAGNVFNQVIIPRGGEYMMQLADGTKVWLNAETEFRYPTVFVENQRKVFLKGEAYFEVTKDSLRPFIVMADEVQVKVYGTCFNVNDYKEGKVQTVLVEGAVGVKVSDREIRLKPGQKGETSGESIEVSEVDCDAYTAWKDGNFIFNNQRLEDIMDRLARWYDVNVSYTREENRGIRLSGDMKRYKDIQSLLYYFEQISEVKFKIEGRTIVVE